MLNAVLKAKSFDKVNNHDRHDRNRKKKIEIVFWSMSPIPITDLRICKHLQVATLVQPALSLMVRIVLDVDVDVDVDVVDLRAQADASMPASNNNVKLCNISNS